MNAINEQALRTAQELHHQSLYESYANMLRLVDAQEAEPIRYVFQYYDPVLQQTVQVPSLYSQQLLATLRSQHFTVRHRRLVHKSNHPVNANLDSPLSHLLFQWNICPPLVFEDEIEESKSILEHIHYSFHGLVIQLFCTNWERFRHGYVRLRATLDNEDRFLTMSSPMVPVQVTGEGLIFIIRRLFQRIEMNYSVEDLGQMRIVRLQVYYMNHYPNGNSTLVSSSLLRNTRLKYHVWAINDPPEERFRNSCVLQGLAIHWYCCQQQNQDQHSRIRSPNSPLRATFLRKVIDHILAQDSSPHSTFTSEDLYTLQHHVRTQQPMTSEDIDLLHHLFHVHIHIVDPEMQTLMSYTSSFNTSRIGRIYLLHYLGTPHVDYVYLPFAGLLSHQIVTCPLCENAFTSKEELDQHLIRQVCQHCVYCQKFFSTASSCQYHTLSCVWQHVPKKWRKEMLQHGNPQTQHTIPGYAPMQKIETGQRVQEMIEAKKKKTFQIFVYDIESTAHNNLRSELQDAAESRIECQVPIMLAYLCLSSSTRQEDMRECIEQYQQGQASYHQRCDQLSEHIVCFEGSQCVMEFIMEIDQMVNQEIDKQICFMQRAPKNEEEVLTECAKRIRLIFMAHNARRYDTHFIFRQLILMGQHRHLRLLNKNGILVLTYRSIVEFRDTLSYMPGSLASLCRDFRIPVEKGLFPYSFLDTEEKLDYVGELPDAHYWNCSEEEYQQLQAVYGLEWNLRNYLRTYLHKDVLALALLFVHFSDTIGSQFQDKVGDPIQPIHFITLPSMSFNLLKLQISEEVSMEALSGETQIFIGEAIRGGRTEVIEHFIDLREHQSCLHLEGQCSTTVSTQDNVGFYLDFNSLYPSIMYLQEFPYGSHRYLSSEEFPDTQSLLESPSTWEHCFFMVDVSCDQVDPITEHIPILPCRRTIGSDNVQKATAFRQPHSTGAQFATEGRSTKLIFDLLPKKKAVYVGVELIYALQHGYSLDHIHSVLTFSHRGPILKPYVDHVMTIKKQQDYYKIHEPEKFSNSARTIAKLMGNSVYGKFLQNNVHSTTGLVQSLEDLQKLVQSTHSFPLPNNFQFIANNTYEVELTPMQTIPLETKSPTYLGAIILAHAHVYLHRLIHDAQKMGNTICYMDTDSIIGFGPRHAYDQLLATHGGLELGQVKDELAGKRLVRALFTAAKSYIIECQDEKSQKVSFHTGFKGFSFKDNAELLNYEQLKRLILGQTPNVELKRQQMNITSNHQLYWETLFCQVGFFNTKRVQSECSLCHRIITYPFGSSMIHTSPISEEEIPSSRYKKCVSVCDFLNYFLQK